MQINIKLKNNNIFILIFLIYFSKQYFNFNKYT